MFLSNIRVFLSRGLFPEVDYRLVQDDPVGKEASYWYYEPKQYHYQIQLLVIIQGCHAFFGFNYFCSPSTVHQLFQLIYVSNFICQLTVSGS